MADQAATITAHLTIPEPGTFLIAEMGFVTNLLNPKIAIMYLSLLPQFISHQHGSVLMQSLILGFTQIAISLSVNAVIIILAASISTFLASRPAWLQLQRWLMGTVLAGLAVRMAVETRR